MLCPAGMGARNSIAVRVSVSADLHCRLTRVPTLFLYHCTLCHAGIRFLADLVLGTVCPFSGDVSPWGSTAPCLSPCRDKAELGKCYAQPKRARLWEYSRGVRGKAAWSCCARRWSGREASHVGVSHTVITQTWKMFVFFLNADLLWWDSWLSVPTLYFCPYFFSHLYSY